MAVGLTMLAAAACTAAADRGDTLVYVVEPGDSLIGICSKHRALTDHYALGDLLTDIREANGLESNFLRPGQKLLIPTAERRDAARVLARVRDGAELRGIYLTGPACGVSSVLQRVDRFIAAGGNAVVFDAKDIDGAVSFHSRHPLADPGKGRSVPVISSLNDMVARFDRRGLYTVARLALFLDGTLGERRPDLALQDSTGAVWRERGCVWMDPARPEVQQYNLTLAAELARAGVDEIQFDYVRFPTNGWRLADEGDLAATAERRRRVVLDFLAAARDTLAPYGVTISADLFGIMAWGRVEDMALTGQDVGAIAELVDVICPMIYPSHFGPGFEGRPRPGDDPAYFISEGTRRFLEMAQGRAEVRPWLQAFPWRVTGFDGQYIATQVVSSREAGGRGWCLWNPSCRYSVALDVMPALCGPDPSARAALPLPLSVAARTEPQTPPAAPRTTPGRGAAPAAVGALLRRSDRP